MASANDFQAKLKVLSDAYAVDLPEKLEQIEQAWHRVQLGEWDEADVQTLHRMVHSLTGSGKTFGFASLSNVARNLEEMLQPLAHAGITPSADQRERIQGLLHELRQAC